MVAGGLEFETATSHARIRYELVGLGMFTAFLATRFAAQVAGMYSGNSVPTALGAASVFMHVMTLRWRSAMWVSVLTIVSDSILFAGTHTTTQCAFWNTLYAPLDLGKAPYIRDGVLEYESLFHGFLYYVLMSYCAQFVFLARHASLGLLCGIPCYFSILFSARSVLSGNPGVYGESWLPDRNLDLMELLLIMFSTLIVVSSKNMSERHARETFELAASQRKLFFKEKILRCQAEFRIESLKGAHVVSPGDEESSYLGHARSEETGALVAAARAPASSLSQHSAPADMLPSTLESFLGEAKACQDKTADGGGRCAMDCFPADSTIWAEGCSAPVRVTEVVPGQRVLCFDRLQGVVKYAPVSGIGVDSEAVEWAEVSLVDGTRLTMTSDHPVQPASSRGQTLGQRTVSAAALSPMSDSVMVHRVVTVPVMVADVSRFVAEGRDRVSVAVCQPDRHHVLVAAPGQRTDVRSLAVGSVGLQTDEGAEDHYRSGHKPRPARPRAPSEPPRLPRFVAGAVPAAALEGPGEEGSPTSGSSSHATTSSSASSDGQDVIMTPSTSLPIGSSTGARVSHLLSAASAGLPSIGSVGHSTGTCNACHFDFRGECLWGISCQYCHGEHRLKRIRGKKIMRPI